NNPLKNIALFIFFVFLKIFITNLKISKIDNETIFLSSSMFFLIGGKVKIIALFCSEIFIFSLVFFLK
ncbi:hypothetical protein, partial [Buchnera aphidicola]|uniref:hypothetical protein n=1 Tax=Buchnera aphidicola TaxID=9 RepID=UPI001C9D9DF8